MNRMATADSDDGVRILYLQEGSVVIVLPPTNTETRRYRVSTGEVLDSDLSSVRSSELYSTTATYSATPVSRSDPSSVRFLELTSMTTTSSDTPLSSSDPSTVRSSEFTATTAASCVTSVFVREDQEMHSSELTSVTKASSVTHVPDSGAGHFNGHNKIPISRIFPEMHHGKIVYEREDMVATCDTGVSSENTSKDRSVYHLSWTPEMREDGTDRFAEGFNLTVKEEEKEQHQEDVKVEGRGSGEDVLKKLALGTHSKTVTAKCAADQRTVQSYTGHYEHTGEDFEESSPQGMSKGCSNPDDTERNDRNRTRKIPSNVPKQGDAYQSDASIQGNGHAWPMFSGEEDFRHLGNMPADDSNQEVGIDSLFVTVLPTGVTRISVKQPRTTSSRLEVAERPMWTKSSNKIANSHNMDSPEGDSASSSCSPDSPKNAGPNEMLFTTHAWHFLDESDRSLEHEEQQADFVFDVDAFTGETEEPGNGTLNFLSATDTIPTAVIREDQGGISAENVEETSGGEWFLPGRTFSRAMWRSVSAEVNQLNPYFTSGVRLHRVSALELHQHSLSSSDEDLSRRQRPTPMFSRFRLGAVMVPRKEDRSKQARNSSLTASKDRNDSGQKKQAKQVLGEEVGPTNRYLHATLSLAESKRSKRKSSSDHLSAQMVCNEPEFEDKASAGKKQKRQRGSITKAEQDKRRAESTSEQPCSPEKPCSSEKPFSQKNARREKRTAASPRNGSTEPAASHALPVQAASKQSSSELTSSDSQWPAVQLTSDRTDGSESSSALAGSVRAVFFVPQRALPRDSSGSSGTVRAQGKAEFNLRQNDGRESSSVLYTETSHSKNSHETEERKVHPAVKRSTRRAKLTAKRAAVRNRTNSFAGSAQPTVTGTGFTNRTDSDTDKSELEKSTDSDAAKNSECPDTTVRRSGRKLKPSPVRGTLPAARTSSSMSSCSDRPSDNSHQQESDSDHKTQLSRSSSNGFFTSESEVGPLVTFPRARERGWKKRGRLDAVDLGHQVEELSAVELRRRFSAEEYVPASPFATCLRRHPSNLSEGAAPLFLQPHVRSSHVRQLSMDIGEEWENANCPTPFLPPTSPLCLPDDGDDDSVFFGPSTPLEKRSASLSGEWIPLAERKTSAQLPSGEKHARKKSHQTSAKLRLLYPNPADPKRSEFSEERKREILSTLTAAELLRLRKAGFPLLKLLREEREGVEGGSRAERVNEMSVESERKKQQAPPTSIHSTWNRPVLTVQPMPQVASAAGHRQAVPGGTTPSGSSSNGNSEDGRQVTVAMPASEGRYNVEALPASKRCLLPNPFNRLNQRCHSTLQCPCCLFFCFLCCLPALFFMSRSDYEFDFGSLAKAKRYGRWTTTAYVVGAAVGVGLIVASVVATVLFLQDTLLEERGWS